MSKLLLTPNYCSCTVNQARNLVDKGKNGIDAFCTISMGKEKFVTAVCEKTTSPDWHEQCDMPIVDDATIKLTVYNHNKNSLSKGDFLGRAYVSLRDLQDYDRVHTQWYKLTNKEGKTDKERGEIEVSLQFYSKNNTTGSVLDLATKKKHLSLKDIKHSLSDKLKTASKHLHHDKNGGANQLADQRRRLGGDDNSTHNGRDFLDDSPSESTSFTGSHMSLNSMSNSNNVEQHKKKSRISNNAFGSTLGNGTPYSSRRSITSDYETSSILDSASMYGGDEPSTPSPPIRSQIQQQQQQQQREVCVDDDLSSKNTSNKKKAKAPVPSMTVPTIITTKPSSSPTIPTSIDHSRNSSVRDDDIDAAFDSINNYKASTNKPKEHEIASTPNSLFGLSTIKENLDTDENIHSTSSSKHQNDEEIDFDNYFNEIKQSNQEKKTKKPAPVIQQSKSTHHTKEQKRSTLSQSDDIQTPATSISVKTDNTPTSSTTLPTTKQSNDTHDSTDEDVDELLGKLETDNKPPIGPNQTPSNRSTNRTLPDIVGEQPVKNSTPRPASSGSKKSVNNCLSVLGYENVKSTPINPKIRQELEYLDRDELLHVIAYQSDLLKKRDKRLKDLEQYADGLLVKIVEQCPTILQSGGVKFNSGY